MAFVALAILPCRGSAATATMHLGSSPTFARATKNFRSEKFLASDKIRGADCGNYFLGDACNSTVVRDFRQNASEIFGTPRLPYLGYSDGTWGCLNLRSGGEIVAAFNFSSSQLPWEFLEATIGIALVGGPANVTVSVVLYESANISVAPNQNSPPIAISNAATLELACENETAFCGYSARFNLSGLGFFAEENFTAATKIWWLGARYSVCDSDFLVALALVDGAPEIVRKNLYREYPLVKTWYASTRYSPNDTLAIATVGRKACKIPPVVPLSSSSEKISSFEKFPSSSSSSEATSSEKFSSSEKFPSSSSSSEATSSSSEKISSFEKFPSSQSTESSNSDQIRGLSAETKIAIGVSAAAAIMLSAVAIFLILILRWRRRLWKFRHRSPGDIFDSELPIFGDREIVLDAAAAAAAEIRPMLEREATDIANSVLFHGISDDAAAEISVCNKLSELLRVDPRKPTAGELEVDSPEPKHVQIELTNADPDGRAVRYCMVAYGGRAYLADFLFPLLPEAGATKFKRVGVLEPGCSQTEILEIRARCSTMAKPNILVMALAVPAKSKNKKNKDDKNEKMARATGKIEVNAIVRPNFKLDPDEIALGRKLGEGSFGCVYEATWRRTTVAVKKFKLVSLSASDMKDVLKEVQIMSNLRNAYVVTLYGMTVDDMSMITEYFPLGSLDGVIRRAAKDPDPTANLSFLLRVRFAADVASGMAFLMASNLLHRDLKPGNVLVTSLDPARDTACCKLTDFGTARMVVDENRADATCTKGVGTPTYMAPEILNPGTDGKPHYSEKSEVYSFAILAYDLFATDEPFPAAAFSNSMQIYKAVTAGQRPDLAKLDGVVPPKYMRDVSLLLDACWQHDPAARLTFAELVDRFRGVFQVALLM